MVAFKALEGRDYSVTSFVVNKLQSYDCVSGSSTNPEQVSIDLAVELPENFLINLDTGSAIPGHINDSGRYAYPLFASIIRSFYPESGSFQGFYPSSSCYVVSVGSNAFGEGVVPGSFTITANGTTSTDDGYGGVYVSGTKIGNIFYEYGIAIIKRNEAVGSLSFTSNGLAIFEGDQTTVNFRSTLTIYEHKAVCKIKPDDFNWSWNPSLLSGSLESGERVYDLFKSGSLTPYFTTIGLYNEFGEMMAVAKVSTAIPRAKSSQQTVVIKFDT